MFTSQLSPFSLFAVFSVISLRFSRPLTLPSTQSQYPGLITPVSASQCKCCKRSVKVKSHANSLAVHCHLRQRRAVTGCRVHEGLAGRLSQHRRGGKLRAQR